MRHGSTTRSLRARLSGVWVCEAVSEAITFSLGVTFGVSHTATRSRSAWHLPSQTPSTTASKLDTAFGVAAWALGLQPRSGSGVPVTDAAPVPERGVAALELCPPCRPSRSRRRRLRARRRHVSGRRRAPAPRALVASLDLLSVT